MDYKLESELTMNERKQDEIIEEWMKESYPQYSTITDLELAEGLHFVKSLRKLINIIEESLK